MSRSVACRLCSRNERSNQHATPTAAAPHATRNHRRAPPPPPPPPPRSGLAGGSCCCSGAPCPGGSIATCDVVITSSVNRVAVCQDDRRGARPPARIASPRLLADRHV